MYDTCIIELQELDSEWYLAVTDSYPWPFILKLKHPKRSLPKESAPHYKKKNQKNVQTSVFQAFEHGYICLYDSLLTTSILKGYVIWKCVYIYNYT